jgi:AraC-like DNA-binding protein
VLAWIAAQLLLEFRAMPETIRVVRGPECPGVELFVVRQSTRVWGHHTGAFSFCSMADWHGSLDYRRHTQPLDAGNVFISEPGELFRGAPTHGRAGSFDVIEIASAVFEEHCRAEGLRPPFHFDIAVARGHHDLVAALGRLRNAFLEGEPLEQQSRLAELMHLTASSLLEDAPRTPARGVALGPCERLREILHSTEGRINLSDFASNAGLSQFQLLRSFKRRYGLPPHAYGLHVRVERGREMLRRGFSVAEAAAANDFTDQSHFTRHFRRIWGVTPGEYASGEPRTRRNA